MNVYEFLRDRGHYPETPELKAKLASSELPAAAVITQLGQTGSDPLCRATNDLFCEIYGAESGNLALKCVAVGGIFVGGGIAPKITVLSVGPHSRRSRLLFQKAFGDSATIGVIAAPPQGYDSRRWWIYSEGVRTVISEAIAYGYARLIFWRTS